MQIILSQMETSIPIIYKYFLNRHIWTINETLTGTTNLSQSGSWSNCNEEEHYSSKTSRTGASPSDSILYHTQDAIKP